MASCHICSGISVDMLEETMPAFADHYVQPAQLGHALGDRPVENAAARARRPCEATIRRPKPSTSSTVSAMSSWVAIA